MCLRAYMQSSNIIISTKRFRATNINLIIIVPLTEAGQRSWGLFCRGICLWVVVWRRRVDRWCSIGWLIGLVLLRFYWRVVCSRIRVCVAGRSNWWVTRIVVLIGIIVRTRLALHRNRGIGQVSGICGILGILRVAWIWIMLEWHERCS